MATPQHRRLVLKKTLQLRSAIFEPTHTSLRLCSTVANQHGPWVMNPKHSFKRRQKGIVPIQSIFYLPTLKNITRNCRPDVEHCLLRQRIFHK